MAGCAGIWGKHHNHLGGKGIKSLPKMKSGFRSVWDLDFPSVKASFCQGCDSSRFLAMCVPLGGLGLEGGCFRRFCIFGSIRERHL